MRHWLLEKLDGIPREDLDDVDFLTEMVRDLYNTIGPEDIFKEEHGNWTIRGKIVPDGIKNNLISEAQTFVNSKLWIVLKDDLKYRANQTMFEKSKTPEDMITGKLWLLTIDCLNTKLKNMVKGKI
jgi:hypothetical protein